MLTPPSSTACLLLLLLRLSTLALSPLVYALAPSGACSTSQQCPSSDTTTTVPRSTAAADGDDDDDDDSVNALNLDTPRLRRALSTGRVYHHRHFLSEAQVRSLLSEVDDLRSGGQFAPSGLSNTNRGTSQDFGEADRAVVPVPWWRDALLAGRHGDDDGGDSAARSDEEEEEANDATAGNSRFRESASRKLQNLRLYLSQTLHRPTMSDPTLDHECYYSRSTSGAHLDRHMDERHEETKGARGWLLPSRRSVSWLVYLSDEGWDVDRNGGALRYFPQRAVRAEFGTVEVGCHGGNLQVGWLVSRAVPEQAAARDGPNEEEEDGPSVPSVPVYLDSWYRATNAETGEVEPHCILYIASVTEEDGAAVTYITKPWLNDAIQGATAADFIRDRAMLDEVALSPRGADEVTQAEAVTEAEAEAEVGPSQEQHLPPSTLFVRHEYARDFRLLEDRQLWQDGGIPDGSVAVDIAPERGSLVLFDSVSVPHEVGLVKDGTRAALAGWFHERTQPFPEDFYES